MNRQRLLVAIAVAQVILILGLGFFWHPVPSSAERELPPPALVSGGDFELTGHLGPVKLADYRGKIVLLYFGYTFCPDICPTSLLATSAGLRLLTPDELDKVQVLFISVDPERDTPKQLADYVAFFHPKIIGITGTPKQIAQLAPRYGVAYRKQAAEGNGQYVVDHSADTYLITPDGRLAGTLPHATAANHVAAAVRALLQGQPLPVLPQPSPGASS
jgi:protein SCO1/2